MIRQYLIKNVASAVVFMSIFTTPRVKGSAPVVSDKTSIINEKNDITENHLIKDAWQEFQEAADNNEDYTKMFCEYELCASGLAEESSTGESFKVKKKNVKKYPKGYRAKRKYSTHEYIKGESAIPVKTIKIVFKNDNKISIEHRDPQNGNKRVCSKEISIDELRA